MSGHLLLVPPPLLSLAADTRSALPGPRLPAMALANCADTSRLRPPPRLFRCRGLHCNSCFQNPSARGIHATAPSPPAAGRAEPSSPRCPDCRTAIGGTLRQIMERLPRVLPKKLAGSRDGRRNDTPPRCTCCASQTSALSVSPRPGSPPLRTNPLAPPRPSDNSVARKLRGPSTPVHVSSAPRIAARSPDSRYALAVPFLIRW